MSYSNEISALRCCKVTLAKPFEAKEARFKLNQTLKVFTRRRGGIIKR